MKRKNEQSTRELMGTKELSDYSIRTYRKDELVYFLIQPSNLSVLSEESLSARIYGLMTVLKGITEIEMMCLNSRENFEDNKRYLKNRAEEETNPAVRKLLELDAGHLGMGRNQKVCCFGKCSCRIVCAKARWNTCDSNERGSD